MGFWPQRVFCSNWPRGPPLSPCKRITKEPWCECNGIRMRKVRNQEKWRCPICGKVYDISDIDWPMPYWDDETGLKNDYGEYMYPNAEKRAGPPEMYDEAPFTWYL